MVSIFDDFEEVSHLRDFFFYLDYLNNGTISFEELRTFFAELGVDTTNVEIETIISSLHLRQKGVITYTEFIAATVSREFYTN